MSDWKTLLRNRDWPALEDWWRHCDDRESVAAFYDRLLDQIPKVQKVNGLEFGYEPVSPSEAPAEWKGGAEIIVMRELEASLNGEPRPASEEWEDVRNMILADMKALIEGDERRAGGSSASPNDHATQSLEIIETMELELGWLLPMFEEERREEFLENMSRFMLLGVWLGSNSRSALGKEFEQHAIRGHKIVKGASDNARRQSKDREARNRAILRKMQESKDAGHSVSAAAQHAYKDGLGASKEANRKLWNRQKTH